MLQAVEEIELAKKVFEKYRPYSVLVWSEAGFNEQIIIKLAKRFDITTILLQHGLYYDTSEAYEFNKLAGIFPLICDKFVVWGETLKQYANDRGISNDKIVVLGSPMHDDLFVENQKNNNSRQGYVLLATSGPVNHLVNDMTVVTNERYEESIKKICQIVSKMNKRLVIKLHPSSVEVDITKIVKEVNSEIEIIKSGSIFPLIKECNVLIVTDISTVIVESQILKKPVISVSIKDYGFGMPSVFKTNSCITTNMDDFECILEKVLNDVEFRKNIVESGTKYVNSYFANQGIASEKLFSFLEKIE
jgi:UDP-N-acetylglucosamine 2-epimerase